MEAKNRYRQKQPLRPSTITKNPARGRRATDRNNGAIKWFAVSGTANGRAKQRPATGLLAGHPGDDSSDQNLYRVRLSHQGRVPSVYQIMILNPKRAQHQDQQPTMQVARPVSEHRRA